MPEKLSAHLRCRQYDGRAQCRNYVAFCSRMRSVRGLSYPLDALRAAIGVACRHNASIERTPAQSEPSP
jgi:hypothetical protein